MSPDVSQSHILCLYASVSLHLCGNKDGLTKIIVQRLLFMVFFVLRWLLSKAPHPLRSIREKEIYLYQKRFT